jgi:hypothetical protein
VPLDHVWESTVPASLALLSTVPPSSPQPDVGSVIFDHGSEKKSHPMISLPEQLQALFAQASWTGEPHTGLTSPPQPAEV